MRIACISDTHLTSKDPASKSLFPRQIAALGDRGATVYETLRQEIERSFQETVEEMKKQGPWDMVIHLGDITGGYLERGSNHPTITPLLKQVTEGLDQLNCPVHFLPENHDLGWRGTGTNEGAINIDSLLVTQEHLGPLFWSEIKSNHLLLGLCSSLIEYTGSNPEILRRKHEQQAMIEEVLEERRRSQRPWILFIHNPFAVKHIPNIQQELDSLAMVYCGDLHSPGLSKPLNILGEILPWQFPGLKKLQICPSSAPLWWKGYAFLEVNLAGNHIESKIINVARPDSSVELPTTSRLRCLLWMLKPQS